MATTGHNRNYYLRSDETVEDKIVHHYLDTPTFKIFASMPEVISKHGHFSFRWTRSPKKLNKWGNQSWTEIATYVSTDGTSWQPIANWHVSDAYAKSKHSDKSHQLTREIHDELVMLKTNFQKKRRRRLARERRQKIKAKQKELDCSAKEAMEIIAEEVLLEKRSRTTKKDIVRTNRIIAVAPLIRELKNEIDAILAQLAEDPSQVNITYISRAKHDFKSVTDLLIKWNKGRRS